MSLILNKINLCIIIIFIAGLIFRFYNLDTHPAGFFADEAGVAYNAYLLSTTGKDSQGKTLPFYVEVFTPRGPAAVYSQIIGIKLFGLNEFGTRFLPALFGSLSIITVFFLTKILFKNNIISILSALIVAITPWSIHFSRFGTEYIFFPFYFSIFLILFIYGINKYSRIFLLLSIIFIFLAFYSYTASNVFIPPFLIGLYFIYSHQLSKSKYFFIFYLILTSLVLIPFSLEMASNLNKSRYSEVTVFKNDSKLNSIIKFSDTYIKSYSPDFLFFKADSEMPNHFINRFSTKGMGQLLPPTIPFVIIGTLYILINIKKKEFQILLLWLLLYPLGSAIAGADGGGPYPMRSIIGSMLFPIITGLGIYAFLKLITNLKLKIFAILLILISIILSFTLYLKLYFIDYPKYSLDFWGWQFGAKEIVQYFIENERRYDKLYMAPEFNAPDIFFKFYGLGRCKNCEIGLPQDKLNLNEKQLFAIPAYFDLDQNKYSIILKKEIRYPNKKPAFYIGEIVAKDLIFR